MARFRTPSKTFTTIEPQQAVNDPYARAGQLGVSADVLHRFILASFDPESARFYALGGYRLHEDAYIRARKKAGLTIEGLDGESLRFIGASQERFFLGALPFFAVCDQVNSARLPDDKLMRWAETVDSALSDVSREEIEASKRPARVSEALDRFVSGLERALSEQRYEDFCAVWFNEVRPAFGSLLDQTNARHGHRFQEYPTEEAEPDMGARLALLKALRVERRRGRPARPAVSTAGTVLRDCYHALTGLHVPPWTNDGGVPKGDFAEFSDALCDAAGVQPLTGHYLRPAKRKTSRRNY